MDKYNASQERSINKFCGRLGVSRSIAIGFLSSADWDLEAAYDAYENAYYGE